ncbi:MAG: response regulator [Candidatus Marinimicrobia bacterium]|nr:response regulator [Candidatus Neomarinimicrobiota bacterium]
MTPPYSFKSMKTRITFWFLIFALLPLLTALIITYSQRVEAIENQTFDKLLAIRDLKVKQLESWLLERHGEMNTLSSAQELINLEYVISKSAYSEADKKVLSSSRRLVNLYLKNHADYMEFFVVNPLTGKILVSSDVHHEGEDMSKDASLLSAIESRALTIRDIHYSTIAGGPSMVYSMPIFCESHNGEHITCVLMARINLKNTLYKMLLDRSGLGETGETLIVNNEVIALNELRWAENAPLNLQIHAEPAVSAARGETGIAVTTDYRDEPILAAYTHIPETGWGFVCKQDMYELNAPVRQLLVNFIYLFVLSTIMVYFVATYLGKTISKPIIAMAKTSTKIAGGDYTNRIEVFSRDELGSLSEAINNMNSSIQNRAVVQEAVLHISETIIAPSNMEDFCTELLKQLMEVTEANMSSFYILNELNSEYEHFTSIGSNPDLMTPFNAKHPEGEFGVAISQKRIVHLRDIPEDTIFSFPTTSGVAIPREIINIPVIVDDITVAIISLVNMHKFSETCPDILKQTWMGINLSYANLLANLRTQVMAENLSTINQRLEAQAEELQQQSEELQSTSDELQNQNVELDMQRAEVEEANRLKSEFLSNMSHELRTPLNSILALSNVLVDQTDERLTEDESSYLKIIARNGRQLLKLINDILDLSKIEAGQMEILPSQFSLGALINDLVDGLRPLANENENTIEVNGADRSLEIISDETLVHRILQNLFGNAIKFTKNGSVTILVEQSKSEISIAVQDTGIGISQEALPLIFEEFRQVDGTTSRQYEGTGLGLAIAHRSAQLLGGELTVVSELGAGCTFMLTIPNRASHLIDMEPLPSLTSSVSPLRKLRLGKDQIRLLVVEDQEPAIIQLRSILEPIGYTIDVARDGRIALDYLENTLPDGIILDLMLPGIDGFEVLKTVRENQTSAHIPILVLSSKNLSSAEIKSLHYNNIQQMIQKGDVNKQDLIDGIGRMLHLEEQGRATGQTATGRDTSQVNMSKQNPKATILIIEDNQDSLTSLKAVLKDQYHLLEAMDGEKGWEMIQSKKPNLVLLDIMLPQLDGYTIAKRAKADIQLRDIPIIAVSGKAMKGDREKMLAAGCDDSLSKPIDQDKLKAKLNKWLM